MQWILLHPKMTPEMLGYIPSFLDEEDPRCARDQIDANYVAGWNSSHVGFKMAANGNLLYPGDPPTRLLAVAMMRDETIMFYEHAWVVIMQEDKSWEVARID